MEELLKQLGLEDEQIAKIIEKHNKEVKTVQTKLEKTTEKLKKVEEKQKEEIETVKEKLEQVEAIAEALGVDLEDGDLSKAFEDYKEEILKTAGITDNSKEFKELQRELAKKDKEAKRVQAELEKANLALGEEKGKRQNQIKREKIKKALEENKVLKADQFVDLFSNKAKFDEDSNDVLIDEIDVDEAIREWATANPEFINATIKTGAGGGSGAGGSDETPDLIKSILKNKTENTSKDNLSKFFGQ